jgi:hypothetical protein
MIFKNKKSGKLYRWLASGIDCTNIRDGTRVVIYRVESDPVGVFVREESEFFEKFEMVS